MAQGALVRKGVVYDITDAASDLNEAYIKDGDDVIAFVPSLTARIGDSWDAKNGFTSPSLPVVGSAPNVDQVQAALLDFGLSQDAVDKVMDIARAK